jgi:hypothetical protein
VDFAIWPIGIDDVLLAKIVDGFAIYKKIY